MSPVEAATGNFSYALSVIEMPSFGPALRFILTYNSQDMRTGMFGQGWSHRFDSRLVTTTDEVNVYGICTKPNGKRDVFIRNLDGSYTPPGYSRDLLAQNPDQTFTLRARDGTVQLYGSGGLLLSITDRNGASLTLAYDSVGFLTTVTDASSRSVLLTKGPNGKASSLRDPLGRVFNFTYDADGFFTGFSDPLGNKTTFGYVKTAPPVPATVPMPLPNSRLISVADPRGNIQTQLAYDGSGRVLTWRDGQETWTYTYSPASKSTTKTDSAGRRWTYLYNDNGNLVKITDPSGNSDTYTLDANANVLSYTDRHGHTTTNTYDAAGNRLTTTDPAGTVRRVAYRTDFNLPVRLTDARGNATTLEYDAKGDLIKTVDPLGATTTFARDAKGQLTTLTDSAGKSTRYEYDAQGNVTKVIDTLGNTRTHAYDLLSRPVGDTDGEGRITQLSYDAGGRMARVTDPSGGVLLSEYDASGNLTAVVTPAGARTTFEYDAFNRLTRRTNPLGQVTTYTYTVRSLVGSRTDARGQTIVYTYDAMDHLTGKQAAQGATTLAYDAMGLLTSVRTPDSALAFTYDAAHRVSSAMTLSGGIQPVTTLRYEYDTDGNVARMIDAEGGSTSYTLDAADRLTSLRDPSGNQFMFAYDTRSRRTSVSRPFGVTSEYTYDDAGRLTLLTHRGGALPLTTLVYGYDRIGNRTTAGDIAAPRTIAYDALDRVVGATGGAVGTESYSYDSVGNRRSSHLSNTYAVDTQNRLLSDNQFDYVYDRNGNLTTKTERASGKVATFGYDAENRLISVVLPDSRRVSYKYDGLNRRIEKTVDGVVKRYVYDREDILYEYDGVSSITQRYTHGPGVDEPLLARSTPGGGALLIADGLGSITRSVTANSIVQSREYDSFGRIVSETGADSSPYAFQGRELDRETGFLFFRARPYDALTGRFTSEDPFGFSAGTNFYTFAENNPTTFVDPYGLAKGTPQECADILSKIRNLEDDIAKRIGEIEKNPLDLPDTCPGGRLRDSIEGHREILRDQQNALNKRIQQYRDLCDDNNDPPDGAPSWLPKVDWKKLEQITGLTGKALIAYIIISELTRLFPPRNLIPVP